MIHPTFSLGLDLISSTRNLDEAQTNSLQTPSTSSHSVFGVILLRSLWILWYLHTYSHNKHKSRSSFSEIFSRHPLCILSFYFPPQVVVIVRNSSIYFLLHLTSLVSVCATFFQLYCKTEVDLYFQK